MLIDQSTRNFLPSHFLFPRKLASILRTPSQRGLSRARNTAIQVSDADVLAWTDDDCILSNSYGARLQEIAKLAPKAKKLKIAGVCGRTLPYIATQPSVDHFCPCTFTQSSSPSNPDEFSHWKTVGLGNNMVLFKDVINEMGEFKEWLGVGSFGESGEDGEFMMRCISAGYTFLYDSELLVYHNKWLEKKSFQSEIQMRKYMCGGLALYGYYWFQGINSCKAQFMEDVLNSQSRVVYLLKSAIKKPQKAPLLLRSCFFDLYYLFKGISLAIFHTYVGS